MEKVFNILEDTKTNWSVKKLPLVAIETTEAGVNELKTDRYGMFRSDNGECLGGVGKRYTVMQNAELAEIMAGIQDRFGGEVKGGSLVGGKKVYYQLSQLDEKIGPDTLKRHITCLSSHDGSSSIGFGSTNTVVSCTNMFHKAMKDIQSFRHTASASDKLNEAVKRFELALENDAELMTTFKRFADTKLTKTGLIEKVVEGIFTLPSDDRLISTNKKNKVLGFKTALDKEIGEKGSTLWGLFNAVTYYTNHIEKDQDTQHLMSGGGYRRNLKAFEIIKSELVLPTFSSN